MTKKKPEVALCYDFDGTLAPGNMQESGFIPRIGMTTKAFWTEVGARSKKHQADNILMYMWLMLQRASQNGIPIRRSDLQSFGKDIPLFDGVTEWFTRIGEFGTTTGVKVTHHLITSGTKEIVEGSPISKHFDNIFASSFCFDHNGIAIWPAMAINYTYKTQFLFRINKGVPDVSDHALVNAYVPLQDRPVPFHNMIYVGDGETDVPCFRLVKDQGGHAIAVYPPSKKGAKAKAEKFLKEGRVNFAVPADYSEKSPLDLKIKAIIEKVAVDDHLYGHHH